MHPLFLILPLPLSITPTSSSCSCSTSSQWLISLWRLSCGATRPTCRNLPCWLWCHLPRRFAIPLAVPRLSLSLPLSHSRCHSSCLFFMSSATNRTRFPHEWAKTSRARLPVCLPVLASLIHSPPSILMLLFLLCLPHWLMRKYAFHRSVASVCCPRFELLLNISPSFCLKSAQYLSISIRTTLKRNTDDLALSKMGTRFLIVSSLIEAFNN